MTFGLNLTPSKNTRAVIASALASLGCGTLYVYSAYSTQLADRLALSATQSAIIGMMGTIGVSLLGVIAGIVVDRLGPIAPTFVGSGLLLCGYIIIYHCYINSIRIIPLVAFGSCMAGFGSTLAYSSSMKTAALNFPQARGTATAFPIATFGLSAFFFSSLSAIFFPGDTAGFLLLLAIITSCLCFFSAPFLITPQVPRYTLHKHINQPFNESHIENGNSALPGRDVSTTGIPEYRNGMDGYGSTAPSPRYVSNDTVPHRDREFSTHSLTTLSDRLASVSDGSQKNTSSLPSSASIATLTQYNNNNNIINNTGSLLGDPISFKTSSSSISSPTTSSSSSSGPSSALSSANTVVPETHNSLHHDTHSISGYDMLIKKEFWAQFAVLGMLAGSGQMYIYCCGYIVRALTVVADGAGGSSITDTIQTTAAASAVVESNVQGIQSLQVAVISLSSFVGRIISGVMSDVLHHHLELQRLWMIFSACIVSIFVHFILATVDFDSPSYLWPLSCLIGLSYGLTFGVFPTIVADTFGMFRYSQNWGMVCISPVFGVYLFNMIFGKIYDSNSTTIPSDDDGKSAPIHVCLKGSQCYSGSFVYTTVICIFTLFIVSWMIWTREHQHPSKVAQSSKYQSLRDKKFEDEEEEAEETDNLTRSLMIP